MKLLLDLGNSRLKWAFWDGHSLSGEGAAQRRLAEDFSCLSALPPPQQVVVCSVAGAATDAVLSRRVQQDWHLNPLFLASQPRAADVINGYEAPASLGVDRWLALLGARALVPGAAVVIDAGTALTIDALDAGGRHLGGLIVPGIALMRRSLQLGTSGIDEGEWTAAPGEMLLGRNTAAGVARGTVLAAAACCARVVRELAVDGRPECLLSGGDAPLLLPLLAAEAGIGACRHEPHLVFKGMVRQLQSDAAESASADSEA